MLLKILIAVFAALVFTILLLVSTYFIRMAGGFGLQMLGVNITARLFYSVNATLILNLFAVISGTFFSATGAYRLIYMRADPRQRLLFFRKEFAYFVYLLLMIGFVLPYLIRWISVLWRITKDYLTQGPLVF